MVGIAFDSLAPVLEPSDQREAERFTLVLRAAKIISGEAEFLCVIRDVSSTGARLRFFHPIALSRECTIEMVNGDSMAAEAVWHRGAEAGFRFVSEVELARLVGKPAGAARRQVRLHLQLPAIVAARGERRDATIENLSQHGAMIDGITQYALGQPLQIKIPGVRQLDARVRWRHGTRHGLVFDTTFSLTELAQVAARAQGLPSQFDA